MNDLSWSFNTGCTVNEDLKNVLNVKNVKKNYFDTRILVDTWTAIKRDIVRQDM